MSEPLSNKKHQYECICCHCGKPFYGDKREVSCPNCSKTNRSLSKVLGLERINIDLYKSPVFRAEILGRNKALDDLDQRSPDVELLSDVIRNCEFKNSMNTTDKILAQEIINKMSVWIVKKG